MILELLNKPKSLIKPVKDRPGHDRRYSIDITKIKKLGWKPEKDFHQALADTVKWYVNNESWWRKIKEKQEEFKRFYNKHYSEH